MTSPGLATTMEGAAPTDPAASGASAPTSSSFYLALRLLPPERRTAMYAVYAFCRAVDDIADNEGPRPERVAALDDWRRAIDALFAGHPAPALGDLHTATRRYDLQRADFEALIDGMAMDVTDDIVAPDRATFDRYVDRVASAPGRLSARVFGLEPEAATRLAHHLGRALQITNILRDVDEDAERGRLYLPRENLAAAGIATDNIAAVLANPRLTAACATLAADAVGDFAAAGRVMDAAPRRTVRAPRLMAAAYRPMLQRLVARGWAPPRHPVSKSKKALVTALLRYGFF